jgi:hypothetical protein
MVVGLRDQQADLFPLQDGQVTVDTTPYDYLYLIVFNLSRAERESDCDGINYSLLTGSADQASPPEMSLAAPHFNPPRLKLLPDN